jgi:hypothetical protein
VKHRRITAIGLGAVAVASLAVSACSSSASNSTGAPASPSVAPAVALTNAIAGLKNQGFNLKIDLSGLSGNGSIDPSHSAGTVEVKGSEQGVTADIAFTQIGSDMWAKVDLGALSSQIGLDPTKWMKLDGSKLTGDQSKPFDLSGSGDAFDLADLVKSVSNVKQTDATHLSGTVDLTAATGLSAPGSDTLGKAGAAAKATPFTATLDDKGRLTELKVNGASSDLSADFQFSDFGSPDRVTPPPSSDVVPAPDAIYQFFNS